MSASISLPDGQQLRLPVGDDAAMDMVLRGTHMLGGWPLIEAKAGLLRQRLQDAEVAAFRLPERATRPGGPGAEEAAALRRAMETNLAVLAEARPAMRAWDDAQARLAPLVGEQLAAVERAARALALRRLDASADQIKAEAARYLTGFDDTAFGAKTLEFPQTTRLRPSAPGGTPDPAKDPVGDLRAKAQAVARAESEATNKDAYAAMASAVAALAGIVVFTISGVAAVHESVARGVQLAALKGQLALHHPVLYRMDLPETVKTGGAKPPTDVELLAALKDAFATTWNAQRALRPGIEAEVWVDFHVKHDGGPAAGLAKALRDRGMKGGLASLLDPVFGPWAFQQVLADAVGDMAGPGPSMVGQAVQDVYASVDPSLAAGFGEAIATMGVMMTLHLIAPPLAVVADIVLAIKGVCEVVAAYLRDRAAYRCALNPSDSLGVEPSVLRAALQCAGEIAGGIPGGGKIAGAVTILAPLAAGLVP